MFLHIVLMQLNSQADSDFFAKVDSYAQRIRNECDGVLMYHCGENTAERAMGYKCVVSSGFTDSAAHDAYQISPAHTEMKAFMSTYIDKIIVYDGIVPNSI